MSRARSLRATTQLLIECCQVCSWEGAAHGLQFLRMFKHTRCFLTGPSVNSVKGAVNETSRIDGHCGRSRLLRSHRVVASRTRFRCRQPRYSLTGIESCRSRAVRLRLLPLLPSLVLAWLPSSLVVVIEMDAEPMGTASLHPIAAC